MLLIIIILTSLVENTYTATASPTWTVNPLFNSGQHKPIFQTSGTGIAPISSTGTQTFNVAFSTTPRAILSFLGYRQNAPCTNCPVGFKYQITTITATGFNTAYTIYGANIFILFYNYLGISYSATQYFTSYQTIQFTTGNLIDTTSASRIHTQIITNPAGQSWPTYPSSSLTSTVFLVGFKMNLGTTGTYINFTSSITSSSSYTITVGTIGDVQIFQICYFRIAYDKNTVQAGSGYLHISDYFYYWGVNSTQQATTTTVTQASFQYRNYLMGFNIIHLASTTAQTDILLQLYITPQTIFSCSAASGTFANTVYAYLWADVFHLRKRVCGTSTPYFYYNTLLCYDVCPSRTYPVTPANYCQNCHYSCLSCNGMLNNNCLTCLATENRTLSNSSCLCNNGYFDNNTAICATCATFCVTCTTSATYCLSCNTAVHLRSIDITTHTCPCANGYYQTSLYTPLVCLSCNTICATCSLAANNCTSCYSIQNRNYVVSNNSCICMDGFYQNSVNNPTTCLACDSNCLTCSGASTYCTSCNATQNRVLNATSHVCVCTNRYYQISINNPITCLSCGSTCLTCATSASTCTSCDLGNQNRQINSTAQTCICVNGYYQTSPGTPIVCATCDPTCLTCSSSSTYCLSCNTSTHHRNLNTSNVCVCQIGHFQVSAGSPLICNTCDPTCITCATSATTCQSCDSNIQHRTINITSSICQCQTGYYQNSLNSPTNCLSCHPTCISCAGASTTCVTCDPINHHRSLNSTTNSCACVAGFYETSLNTPTVCLSCSSTCASCLSSATNCLTCNAIQNRNINTTSNSCTCINGFYETSLNNPSTCLVCNSKCLTCSSSSTTCTSCDSAAHRLLDSATNNCKCMNGFYEDTVNGTGCQPCTQVGCLSCSIQNTTNQQTCTACNSTLNFVLNSVTASVSNCVCSSGFYLDVNNSLCTACNYRCLTCTNAASCSTCSLANHHRQLNATASNYCQCVSGYYEDGVNRICPKCDLKCLSCTASLTNCLSCDTTKRYFTSNGTFGSCLCNNGTLESSAVYGQCISPYTICGNGIIQSSQQCDDHNTNSNDGCSSECKIQQYHTCSLYSNGNGTSLCYYNRQLNMTISSVLKQLSDNKINILIQIQAILCNLNKLKQYLQGTSAIELIDNRRILQNIEQNQEQQGQQQYQNHGMQQQQQSSQYYRRITQTSRIIYISSANFIITNASNYQGFLSLTLDYTQSISTLQNKQLKFINSNSQFNSKYFFSTPNSLVVLQDPYNKIPINFYSATDYKTSLTLSYIFLVLCAINLLFFLIMSILKKSVIPLQNILILQFAYFGIMCQKQVQLAIGSLAYWGKFSIGVNINIIQTKSNQIVNNLLCMKMGKIYQDCNIINNINIGYWVATVLFGFVVGCNIYKYRKQIGMNNQNNNDKSPTLQINKKKPKSDENGQLNNNSHQQNQQQNNSNSQQQKSSDSNHVYLTYYFPQKIKQFYLICLQVIYGLYFMTSIQYLLAIINHQKQTKIIGIVYAIIIGLLFIGLWVFWGKQYPVNGLSYFQIVKYRVQKISVQKFAYLGLFVFLVIWGALISIVPGIVSYSLLMLICLYWLVLTHRTQIYKQKLHKIRSTINQILTISITLIYILLQYIQNDGLGTIYAIIILALLILSLINNIGITIYIERIYYKNLKIDDEQQFKYMQQEMYNKSVSYTSRKIRHNNGQDVSESYNNNAGNSNFKKQFEMTTPKRQPLIQASQIKQTKQTIRSKVTQLKTFRKQLKIPKLKQDLKTNTLNKSNSNNNMVNNSINQDINLSVSDQKRVQILSNFSNNNARKITKMESSQDEQYKDL